MDWKDILAQKVNDGELSREEFVIDEKNEKKNNPTLSMCALTAKVATGKQPQ